MNKIIKEACKLVISMDVAIRTRYVEVPRNSSVGNTFMSGAQKNCIIMFEEIGKCKKNG